MADVGIGVNEVWAPSACTLPTERQPLRIAEFDALFTTALVKVTRVDATRLRLALSPGSETTARELTDRESRCCSFFAFSFSNADNALCLDIEVPAAHVAVLDGLEAHAVTRLPAPGARTDQPAGGDPER